MWSKPCLSPSDRVLEPGLAVWGLYHPQMQGLCEAHRITWLSSVHVTSGLLRHVTSRDVMWGACRPEEYVVEGPDDFDQEHGGALAAPLSPSKQNMF